MPLKVVLTKGQVKGMRLWIAVLSAISFFGLMASFLGYSQPSEPRKWALIIGINGYEYVRKLRFCEADAELLAQTLIRDGGYSPERVLLMTEGEAQRKNQPRLRPTLANILEALNSWLGVQKEQDVVLFFFAGHGMRSDKGEDFLLPIDATPAALERTAIPVSFLLEKLRRSGAKQIVCVFDACRTLFEGARGIEIQSRFGEQTDALLEAEVILRSCKPEEISWEDEKLGHGVYTFFLAEALSGKADADKDGAVTVEEAHRYVFEMVTRRARERNEKQTPEISKTYRQYGEIVLAGNPLPPGTLLLTGSERGVTVFVDGEVRATNADLPLHIPVRVGRREIIVRKEGMAEFSKVVFVQSQQVQPVEVHFKAERGSLRIVTEPEGATVWLQRVRRGETKGEGLLITDLAAGEYLLRIEKEGFYPYEQSVNIEAGKEQSLRISLLPRRKEIGEGKGFLFVDSEPAGVDVYLDGRLIGKTPIWQEIVSVGRHRLELRSETHANLSEEIEVEDASVVRKSYRLKPAFGNLVVFTDIPDAKVSVGGQEVPLRDGRGEVRLPGGDYEVVVSWGQWQLRRKVVVLKERTVEEYFRARDCVGHLTILSDEPIKGLTVNGVKMDVEVPLTLKNLPVGEYVVRSLREVGEIWEIWEGSARVTAGRTEILRLTKRTMKKFFLKHGAPISSVAFSPDGKFLASGSDDNTVKVWEVGSWREVITLRHGDRVRSVSFSPDGKFLASGSKDNTVKVWEVGSWREVTTLRHGDWVDSVTFSPDGKFLASCSSGDHTVKVWMVGNWRQVATLRHPSWVFSVSFSPDNKFLASGSEEGFGIVKVWEVGSWKEVVTLKCDSWVISVAFSPDGKFLAEGSGNEFVGTKTGMVWEVGSWRQVATLKHEGGVTSVTFSPDSKFLASGSADKTVKVWEVGSWQEVATLRGHQDCVSSVSFSPDGKFLASGSDDGTIGIWATEILLSQR
jgi:hypothetical protein